MLAAHEELRQKIEEMERIYDENLTIVFEAIKELLKQEEEPGKKIGYIAGKNRPNTAQLPLKSAVAAAGRAVYEYRPSLPCHLVPS